MKAFLVVQMVLHATAFFVTAHTILKGRSVRPGLDLFGLMANAGLGVWAFALFVKL